MSKSGQDISPEYPIIINNEFFIYKQNNLNIISIINYLQLFVVLLFHLDILFHQNIERPSYLIDYILQAYKLFFYLEIDLLLPKMLLYNENVDHNVQSLNHLYFFIYKKYTENHLLTHL